MAGLGSESKLGIRKETTAGTGVVPTETTPFSSEGFSAPRTQIQSETISGGAMVQAGVPGDAESTGSITQEYDGETSGNLVWFANGDNGYTANGAFTDGQITTAPGETVTGSGASLAAGDYLYSVAAVWTHDFLEEDFIMPDSAASTAATITSDEQVDLTWTDPTGLTLADHTYKGTAIYRTSTGGAASTLSFLAFVSGTGAAFSDTGADTNRDTTVSPVSNTTLYSHTIVGASAASGQDRLDYASVQISKNVGSDERYVGNKLGELDIAVGGRGEAAQLTANFQGDDVEEVAGEFSATSPTVRQPTLGRNTKVVIAGSRDCDIQAWNWNLNNNLERQATLCGVTIAEGLRVITGGLTQVFQDRVNFNRAVNADEVPVQIYSRGEPLDASGSTLSLASHGVNAIPFPRLTKIDMERVQISDFANPVEGPGQIIANATYQAFEGATSSTDATVTIINTTSVYDGD